jgi:MFS family permease
MYFSHRINTEVKEIYWQTFIANLAVSLVFIFEPIYLYTLGYSLVGIMWFYVYVYAWYVVLIGPGAKLTGKIGYKHAILLSNFFYVAYWIVLYLVKFHYSAFFIAPVLFALQKSFFWPAFDADVAIHDKADQRGREVGVLFSIIQITFIIAPVIAGLVSTAFGFLALFILASVLMLLSAYPIFRTKDIYPRHRFRFKDLWAIFKDFPSNFFGYWGYAEDLMVMSLWPVYIFIVVPKFTGVGVLTTIAMLVAAVLMLYVGNSSDHIKKQFLIERNSLLYGITWIFRFLAQGVGLVLLFDILTKSAKGLLNIPMVALTFEIAGSKDADYAIAYSVFYEFSLAVGKIITALAAIVILTFTDNIFIVFGFVGLLTMFYGFLRGKN